MGRAPAPRLPATLGLVGHGRGGLGDHLVHCVNGRHQGAGGFNEAGNLAHAFVKGHEDGNGAGAMFGQEAVGQFQLVVAVEHAEADVVAGVGQAQDGRRGGHGVAAPVGGENRQVDGLGQSVEVVQHVAGNFHAGVNLAKRVFVDFDDVDVLLGGHTLGEFFG